MLLEEPIAHADMPASQTRPTSDSWNVPAALRRVLLALVLFGTGGLLLELVLLEHYDSVWKCVPLVLLGIVLLDGMLLWLKPTVGSVRVFQALMMLCLASGAAGLYLHYRGNVEFEIERDPSLHGLALFWSALRGATPSLAPAAIAQLGLLGLIVTYRHPSLRRSRSVHDQRADAEPGETT
jgi:hypothetical protein